MGPQALLHLPQRQDLDHRIDYDIIFQSSLGQQET